MEIKRIRLLIADDHQVVRRGLQAYLQLEPDLEVVGVAEEGESAWSEYNRLRPDVLILDLQMQPSTGQEALERIMKDDPKAKILVLTSFIDASYVLPAIEAGACGYLLKTAAPNEIVQAIRAVADGQSVFDPEAMQVMADSVHKRFANRELTQREGEVLRLIACGKSNQEIGDALFIGIKTVKTHVSSILAKLDLTDRTQAAIYAIHHGLHRER
jgi:NarL family two-component system response regulator LiaR